MIARSGHTCRKSWFSKSKIARAARNLYRRREIYISFSLYCLAFLAFRLGYRTYITAQRYKMADTQISSLPTASPLWRLWQGARGLDGSHITLPDADCCGKWIVITGGNNGIGREAALRFASSGASIVLGCRQPPAHEKHPDATVTDCIAAARAAGHGSSEIEWWPCDMADLSSVEAFAKRWLCTGHPLAILVNNAGMGRTASGKLTKTIDGFEIVHQVKNTVREKQFRIMLSKLLRSTS